jgi:DNA-binding NarL/FixJ family response regulator
VQTPLGTNRPVWLSDSIVARGPIPTRDCYLRLLASGGRRLDVLLNKTSVLLTDDHPGILEQVRMELADDFAVVGAVENGRDAIDAVLRLNPDVLVTDISMPILDGFQVVSRLRKADSRTKTVFLTMHADLDFVAAALSAGACGYVLKAQLLTDLVPAICEALEGRVFVSDAVKLPH